MSSLYFKDNINTSCYEGSHFNFRLKVKDCKLQDLKADITTLNDQIAKFQTDIKMKDGHIKRLERKLAFVTKVCMYAIQSLGNISIYDVYMYIY